MGKEKFDRSKPSKEKEEWARKNSIAANHI
jgi:hypothetical protein